MAKKSKVPHCEICKQAKEPWQLRNAGGTQWQPYYICAETNFAYWLPIRNHLIVAWAKCDPPAFPEFRDGEIFTPKDGSDTLTAPIASPY